MNELTHWLHGFMPRRTAINRVERFRACCGALLGILLTGLTTHWMFGSTMAFPMLVAPMGASAVLLFALPSSPLAQPWSIIGGNLVSATLGVTSALLISDPMLASAVAIAAAIGAMMALRCIHPPSGAVALTAVLGGPAIHNLGYYFLLTPIGINSVLLLAVAMVFNNLTRHRYPHRVIEHGNTHHTTDQQPGQRLGFNSEDLDYVLTQYNEILDVSRDDLETLLYQAEMHAYRRRFGEITCADIMSRDVISVDFATELQDAWTLMHEHDIKALPVISSARHVIGIVTFADFTRHAGLHSFQDFDTRMRLFLKRITRDHSEKPEVVGQIMTKHVHTATDSMHIVELVDLLSNQGVRHIPIVNGDKRLVGIVTNSDLVAGLYRGRLTS